MKIKVNDSLLNEQIEYLKLNKDRICKEYYGKKVGFDLNLTFHFGSLAYFELNKVYSEVCAEIYYSDSIVANVFGDAMDSCWIQQGAEFSLQECMKAEAKMVILTNFVQYTLRNKKKYYPSEIKRKEKVLNNAHKRACEVIDTYFKQRDINFSEVKDVFDHYEIIVSDQGKIVDFHFGSYGFSLNKEASSYEILEYVCNERAKYKVAADYIKTNEEIFNELRDKLINEKLLTEKVVKFAASISIGSYELQTLAEKDIVKIVDHRRSGVEKLYSFLKDLKVYNSTIPGDTFIDVEKRIFRVSNFSFNFEHESASEFLGQLKNYQCIETFVDKVEMDLVSNQLNCSFVFKNNVLKINARKNMNLNQLRRRLQNIHINVFQEGVENTPEERPKNIPVNLILTCQEGKLYRETGEEVLTTDVILFEIMEKLRTSDKEYFVTVERAKEMMLSVLSTEEEELMKSENITIVEGQKNYYALINRTYNNVVKIPKDIKNSDEIKALCIHPAESSVPMYDGFASIVLSVKSGDEDYVLENSNEFTVQQKVKEKVLKVFKNFVPNKELSFA